MLHCSILQLERASGSAASGIQVHGQIVSQLTEPALDEYCEPSSTRCFLCLAMDMLKITVLKEQQIGHIEYWHNTFPRNISKDLTLE